MRSIHQVEVELFADPSWERGPMEDGSFLHMQKNLALEKADWKQAAERNCLVERSSEKPNDPAKENSKSSKNQMHSLDYLARSLHWKLVLCVRSRSCCC